MHRISLRIQLVTLTAALFGCQTSDGSGDPAGTASGDPSGEASSSVGGSMGSASTASSSAPASSSPDPASSGDPAGSSGSAMGCDGVAGEGYAVGDIAENWTLLDGSGNDVNLHDYCGKVVFIEIGAEW